MTFSLSPTSILDDSAIAEFFRQSSGEWRSERRYYTLPGGDVQEAISLVTVRFLPQGCPELEGLAQLLQLSPETILACGSHVTWDSQDRHTGRKISSGTTIFGVAGDCLYRDRGFSTPKPVIASFQMPNPLTLQLRTEYSGSEFEEEIKLIGTQYRTRQTIVTRAGEQQLVGQYLETRLG